MNMSSTTVVLFGRFCQVLFSLTKNVLKCLLWWSCKKVVLLRKNDLLVLLLSDFILKCQTKFYFGNVTTTYNNNNNNNNNNNLIKEALTNRPIVWTHKIVLFCKKWTFLVQPKSRQKISYFFLIGAQLNCWDGMLLLLLLLLLLRQANQNDLKFVVRK